MNKIIENIKFMDEYVCKNLCGKFDTELCPWTKAGMRYPFRSINKEAKSLNRWRKACYKFRCKNIGVTKDELDGGIPCAEKCPVWYVCNMFKERIRLQYQDYLLSKEQIQMEYR